MKFVGRSSSKLDPSPPITFFYFVSVSVLSSGALRLFSRDATASVLSGNGAHWRAGRGGNNNRKELPASAFPGSTFLEE